MKVSMLGWSLDPGGRLRIHLAEMTSAQDPQQLAIKGLPLKQKADKVGRNIKHLFCHKGILKGYSRYQSTAYKIK